MPITFPEISFGIYPEISGKIVVLFRKNSAGKFQKLFHETSQEKSVF